LIYLKIFLLSHPRFQHNNLVETIHIFLNNGYPLPFIFSTIENRLKFHIYNKHATHNPQINEKFFTVLYVKSISESFSPIPIMFHCKFSITNTLKSFIKRGKNKSDLLIKIWSIRSHVMIARLTILVKPREN